MKINQRNKAVLARLKTLAIIISASLPAFAYSQSLDADTMINSFNGTFYVYNGGNAYFEAGTGGGTADFWKFAEMIEMEVDAYERSGNTTYLNDASSLVNGFVSINGSSWSSNSFNDDVMWMCIACLRVYGATGNTTFRTYAQNNFDMVYARAWDTTLGGGLWWNTSKGSKNACVNGPGAIAACLLYQALNDSTYLTKAQNIYNWEHSHLFNTSTGAVYDSEFADGSVDQSSYSYNLGTFIGATDYLGTEGDGELAANYEMNVIAGGGPLPNYGQNGDGGGFNGIFARWLMKFVRDNNLYSTYTPWLVLNANAALNVRLSESNLSWNDWSAQTPSGTLASFDCSSSVVLMQVVGDGSSDWFFPGAGVIGPMGADADGRMEIYGVTTNSQVWHDWQVNPSQGWMPWAAVGANATNAFPGVAVARNLNGALEVFVAAYGGGVWHCWQSGANSSWGSWMPLGGPGITNVVAAANLSGRLQVFGIGTNTDVWTISQNSPGGTWSSWTDLAGAGTKPGFVVGENISRGTLELFGVGSGGNVYHNWQTGYSGVTNWNGWATLAGGGPGINPRLAIGQNADTRLQVFGVGTNGDVWSTRQDTPAGSWTNWTDMGVSAQPGFAVGRNLDGRMEMVATTGGSPVHLWQTAPSGSWTTNWMPLGATAPGSIDPQLTSANNSDGRVQVFGLYNGDVWSTWQNSPGGTWSDWTDMGKSGIRLYPGQ